MTIAEARALLAELDELLKPKIEPPKEVVVRPTIISRVMDGGTF